jgi:hypothetical protein
MSWETIESFKAVIKKAIEDNTGYVPESIFISFMQPLEEHNPDVELTTNAKIGD